MGNPSSLQFSLHSDNVRAKELCRVHLIAVHQSTDNMFAWVMPLQGLASVIIAYFVLQRASPMWVAIVLGGLISLPATVLAHQAKGTLRTRYVIVVSQMLMAGLLGYLLGGRIYIYVSLALLSRYRDWRALILATGVTTVDHLIRGWISPLSISGVLFGGEWSWVTTVGGVGVINILLITYCIRARREMLETAQHTAALESNEVRFRALTEAAPDVIITINQKSEILFANAAAEKLLGYKPEELLGRSLSVLMTEDMAIAHRKGLNRWLETGQKKLNWNGTELMARHATGPLIPVALSFSHFKLNGEPFFVGILRDISIQKQAIELLRQSEQHAALRAEIGEILARQSDPLRAILQQATDAIVHHLNPAFARIWTLNTAENVLELQASAGLYKHTDGKHKCIPVGMYKIGAIAQERLPHLTNNVQNDERISDREWAQREGLVAFAGYPLMVEDSVVGVLAMFAREPLTKNTLEVLAVVASIIAQRIKRQATEEALTFAQVNLERRVAERTQELVRANEAMQIEVKERERAEQELDEAKKFLHSVVNGVPNPIFVKNEEGKFHLVNTAFAQLYGKRPEEMIGKADTDFQKPEEAEKFIQDDKEVLKSLREKLILEEKNTDFQGNVRWLQTVKRPLILESNQPHFLLGISTDLSERKVLESQLRQAQKLESIGQLAAGIAHEINTPTQFVGDNTRFVQDAFQDMEVVRSKMTEILHALHTNSLSTEMLMGLEREIAQADVEYLCDEIPKALQQALEGVSRISSIVQSMKDFSHPGSNEKKASDLNKAIASTITVARNEWKYVADLETDFEENLPSVVCQVGEINQVILNMVINAAHAISDITKNGTQGKGKITVTTRSIQNKWVEIRIRDTGTGIPPHARERIFDPFFTTKAVGKGTGQGLAISYAVIVERHQGQLLFETEIGQGTTFIIRLPLSTLGTPEEKLLLHQSI